MGTNSKLCRTSNRRSYSRITIIHLTRPRTDRRRRYSRRQVKTKRSAVKPPSKWRRSVRVPWHSPRSLLLPRGANLLPISHKPTIHKPSAPLFWDFPFSHFPFTIPSLILPLPHSQDIFQKSIDTYFFIIFLSLPLFHTRLNTFSKHPPTNQYAKLMLEILKLFSKNTLIFLICN